MKYCRVPEAGLFNPEGRLAKVTKRRHLREMSRSLKGRERSISEFRGKTQRGGLEEKDEEMWRPGPGRMWSMLLLTNSTLFPTSSFLLCLHCGGWTREVYLLPASLA